MVHKGDLVIIGICVGVALGILIAVLAFLGFRWYKRHSHRLRSTNSRSATLPIHTNGIDSSIVSSASISQSIPGGALDPVAKNSQGSWWGHQSKDRFTSVSGMPKYYYRDVQKATQNFTTILGQGSFGPVYKATMLTGEVVAVKVLASDSKQGELEFQTEVFQGQNCHLLKIRNSNPELEPVGHTTTKYGHSYESSNISEKCPTILLSRLWNFKSQYNFLLFLVSLLGRLHHRNLVNLVGYCIDKGQHMLIYQFMSNGSLADLLYGEGKQVLSWDDRLQIALDISHGVEYLHDGAVPPVIHRDLKSANILLDNSMRAKVADFGLSKEESFDGRKSTLKGTYGYIDPAYISTNKFTTKSDVYSFGIILFELITAIHPHQNLMEYVDLACMSSDGVDEILDNRLVGECEILEVRRLASVAHKCLQKTPRRRPSIGEVSQAILKIKQRRLAREDTMMSSAGEDLSRVVSRIELQQAELTNMTSINKRLPE